MLFLFVFCCRFDEVNGVLVTGAKQTSVCVHQHQCHKYIPNCWPTRQRDPGIQDTNMPHRGTWSLNSKGKCVTKQRYKSNIVLSPIFLSVSTNASVVVEHGMDEQNTFREENEWNATWRIWRIRKKKKKIMKKKKVHNPHVSEQRDTIRGEIFLSPGWKPSSLGFLMLVWHHGSSHHNLGWFRWPQNVRLYLPSRQGS